MARQQGGAAGVVQLCGVVEQQDVTGLGERVTARRGTRRQLCQGGIPLRREVVADLLGEPSQLGEGLRLRSEGTRPGGRVAVDLVSDGERGRVPQHDVGVARAAAGKAQPGAEGEVIDDDRVGACPVDDVVHGASHTHGVPEQVDATGACLVGQRLDGAEPRRLEEPAERVVLAGRLLLGPDDARVRAATELEVLAFVAEGGDESVGRRAGGDDDALTAVAPGRGEGGKRVEVRGVVRD